MSIDLRAKHDRVLRELAAGLFASGHGYESVANRLGIPARAVRKWQQTYRAVGRGGLPNMGKTHARYDFETKVAAASVIWQHYFGQGYERIRSASLNPAGVM